MNGLIYKLFFPFMLFSSVMKSDIGDAFDWKLLVFVLSLVTVIYLILIWLVKRFVKENKARGVMVQGLFRSNFIVFGLSIVTSLYGEEKLGPAVFLAAIVVPYMNALSVVVLEIFRGNRPGVRKVILAVLKNPIIDFTVVAVIFKAVGFNPLPSLVSSIASMATPFALLVIGAGIRISDFRKYRRLLMWGVAGKLLIIPAIAVSLGVLAGYRNEVLVSIMCIFGGPCATASSAMAQQMDGDGDLATLLVMATSALCIISFFVWIFILKVFNLA